MCSVYTPARSVPRTRRGAGASPDRTAPPLQGVDIATALQGSFQSASGTSRKVENNKRNASSVASQTKSGADALGTFDGIYVGKVPVTKEDGDDVVKDAVKRLLGGADKQSDPVAIVVTAMNMKVIDTFQGTVMFKQYMRTVTYSTSRVAPLLAAPGTPRLAHVRPPHHPPTTYC